MVYAGNPTYLKCAENQKRYGECAKLSICVEPNTRSHEFIASRYSPDFYETGLSLDMLENNTCNILAAERLQILKLLHTDNNVTRNTEYKVGNTTYTNEPLAIVTRNNDRVFSDIVNWVIQALVFGKRHGISKDESMCLIGPHAPPTKTSFLNMLYCVGNYDEVIYSQYGDMLISEINTINRGTAMLYVTPLGKPEFMSYGKSIERIRRRGYINCGAMIRDGYSEDLADVHGLYGMGIRYCQSLAAAIFHGNSKALKYIIFVDDQSGAAALRNGTIDVLAGIEAGYDHDFGTSLDQGITFSMPYYLSNETGR
jgi:ABC-type amino acid transport substrate-binding protein